MRKEKEKEKVVTSGRRRLREAAPIVEVSRMSGE